MKRKEAKDKFYGQDDVDIFEGGPAGQTLVDVDPFYGGIQRPEDQLWPSSTGRSEKWH